jgi:hypothetical protein
MEIRVTLDLSRYTREQLNELVRDGILTVKEYYDELALRHAYYGDVAKESNG